MTIACTLEADSDLLRYSEQRMADLYTTDADGTSRGYATRADLIHSARNSYQLFRIQRCPDCGGRLGGELRVLYHRILQLLPEGYDPGRWHRALDVQLECPSCGFRRRNLLGNGPTAWPRPAGAIAISRC